MLLHPWFLKRPHYQARKFCGIFNLVMCPSAPGAEDAIYPSSLLGDMSACWDLREEEAGRCGSREAHLWSLVPLREFLALWTIKGSKLAAVLGLGRGSQEYFGIRNKSKRKWVRCIGHVLLENPGASQSWTTQSSMVLLCDYWCLGRGLWPVTENVQFADNGGQQHKFCVCSEHILLKFFLLFPVPVPIVL